MMKQLRPWGVGIVLGALLMGCATDEVRDAGGRQNTETSPSDMQQQSAGATRPTATEIIKVPGGPEVVGSTEASSPSLKGDVINLQGEVLRVNGRSFESSESYLIRDVSGQERLVHLGPDTKIQGRLEIGDRITAQIRPDGRAISITALSADTGGASPGSMAPPSAVLDLQRQQDLQRSSAEFRSAVVERALRGDLLRMEGEYFIIRDQKGAEVRLQVDKDTKMEDAVQVGDKIEVDVSAGNHAQSVRKLKDAPQLSPGGTGSASPR